MFTYSWRDTPMVELAVTDKMWMRELLREYGLKNLLRFMIDEQGMFGEDKFLEATARAFREKGNDDHCAGCKAAAEHLQVLAEDNGNREFVTTEGAHCPNCFSTNTEGGSFDIDGGLTEQRQSCYDCESTWISRSLLIGYRDLETESDRNANDN